MKTKDHDEKILIKKKMHTLFTTAREIVSGVCICFLSHFDPDYVLLTTADHKAGSWNADWKEKCINTRCYGA